MSYNPANWYWIAGNKPGVVFASARSAYVPPGDASYAAWLVAGNQPTPILCDGELTHVLWKSGLVAAARAAGVTSLGAAGGMTADDAVAMLCALGIEIASTSTPALDGVYPADPGSRSALQGLLVGYMLRGVFPGGLATVAYLDATGAAHAMTQPQLQAVGAAMEDYVAAVIAWGLEFAANPLLAPPSAAATIA